MKNNNLLPELLKKRGLIEDQEIAEFLNPDYDRDLHDPFLLQDMKAAVERIIRAIKNNEKVVIYSDYDADGIPGGVVLHDFFKKVGFNNFSNYIPHRHFEGFGLNSEAVAEFAEQKVNLVITIDCGIADVEEAEELNEKGIDLIITDHHEPGVKLPKAVAVIDPKRSDCKYPFKGLCGSGVIFKVIQAILTRENFGLKAGQEKWWLDLVGLATLSDMVPLCGENRALAFYGLKVLRKSPRPGLQQLLRLLKLEQNLLTEDDVGFSISPRINAASRMGNPAEAFNLFSTTDEAEAGQLAKRLDEINSERKGVVAAMVKEVNKIMEKRLANGEKNKRVLVIGNPDWRPSLVGLVANSLKDVHGCPVFLWGRDGGNILKGSCRSDGTVDLVKLMHLVGPDILGEYGGHAMSGGFSVLQEKVHLLEERLNAAYEKLSADNDLITVDEVELYDLELTLDDVTPANYREITRLAPFGKDNPKPTFLFKQIRPTSVRLFGKENNHLELVFKNSLGKEVKAVGFFMTDEIAGRKIRMNEVINLIANFEQSTFRGRTEFRLRIVELEHLD